MDNRKITGYIQYFTQEGDTFDSIALQQYDNEMLSSLIIQENIRYCDTLIFEAGVLLYIPMLDTVEAPDTLPPWRRGV